MKNFIDPEGKFILQIPLDWEFINAKNGENLISPYQFSAYKKPIGVFTISCVEISKNMKEKGVYSDLPCQLPDKTNLIFSKKKLLEGEHEFTLWTALIDNYVFTVSFNYENIKTKKHLINKEIMRVEEVLKSIMFISFEKRDQFIASERYKKFLVALTNSRDLENRAGKNGSFIELVAVLANQIDGLLRIAIMLNNQIKNLNENIDISWIYQYGNDDKKTERSVYKYAFEEGIIDDGLYQDLQKLYDERNKVIHRYIITDLRTEDVLKLAIKYHDIRVKLDKKIYEIELLQYNQKVGIYGKERHPHEKLNTNDKLWIKSLMKDKHGNIQNY